MAIKITLRSARVNAGYTLVRAANMFQINKDTLSKYEHDSTNVPRSFVMKIEKIYKIPVEHIFFGNQSDFFRKIKSDCVENLK